MRKCELVIALLGAITFLSTGVRAAVVDIFWMGGELDSRSFDYDLQQLTVTQTISELDRDDYYYDYGFGFMAFVEQETTFTVVATFTNNTGVTWTSYILESRHPHSGLSAGIVPESLQSTMLQAISYLETWYLIEFREPPPVLDGESLTLRFDMITNRAGYPESSCDVILMYNFIPEPTTIALLGLGGLALLRTRRAQRVA